jgi:hypothetical protein
VLAPRHFPPRPYLLNTLSKIAHYTNYLVMESNNSGSVFGTNIQVGWICHELVQISTCDILTHHGYIGREFE